MILFGVILAGGQSRRFGPEDKRLALLDGVPLISHVARRLRPQVVRLAVAAGEQSAGLSFLNLPLLGDRPGHGLGPAGGLLAGLFWARTEGAAGLITAPADTPFLPLDLAARLTAGEPQTPAIAAQAGRQHPAFSFWPVYLADKLETLITNGERRMMALSAGLGARIVEWPDSSGKDGAGPFLNINAREDLAAAAGFPATPG